MFHQSERKVYCHTPGVDITTIAKTHCKPHKLFLNLVREMGTVKVSLVIKIFSQCCIACKMEHTVSDKLSPAVLTNYIVQTINNLLDGKIFGKLEVVSDERFPNEQYIIFIWPAVNQSLFSELKIVTPEESKYFYEIIGKMFAEENENRGEISVIDAVNLSVENDEINVNKTKEFLKKLVTDSMLILNNKRKTYSLHPKAIAEFQTVLTHPDYGIPTCPICRKLIVLGRTSTSCSKCENKIHNMCIYRMLKKSDSKVRCPGHPVSGGHCENNYDKNFAAALYFDDPIDLNRQEPVITESSTTTEHNSVSEPDVSNDDSIK